jgi:beta-N-acetylhexosaminidase
MLTGSGASGYPLEKKLYQLIITRLNGEDVPSMSYRQRIFELVEKGVGGFIIFGGKRDEVRHFIGEIQSASEMPLFVASDVERGAGQQIEGCTLFPCQMAVTASIDRNNAEHIAILHSAIKAIAHEVKDAGINMPLIPVLDVNRNPDNPIICTRAFSDDPEVVAWFGAEYITMLESYGLMSCAKHFPGHGDTSADSHISLPVINKSVPALMDADIRPFREAISAGVSCIMLGHLNVPALDNKPSSLSGKVIRRLLREELGFNGLVLTDALNMQALKNIDKVPSKSIGAGTDILLHPFDPHAAVKELVASIESGEIAEEDVDTAFDRIVKAKERFRDVRRYEIDYQEHERLSAWLAGSSITLYRNTAGVLPISDRERVLLVLSGDDKLYKSSPLRNYFDHVSSANEPIEVKNGVLIIAVFTSVAAWKGSSGIGEDEKSRIHELIERAEKSVVLSFGSPYVLRHFREADILIAAYEATDQAQHSVMRCLEGETEFKGRPPVKIDVY